MRGARHVHYYIEVWICDRWKLFVSETSERRALKLAAQQRRNGDRMRVIRSTREVVSE